eukprot:m.111635 g.111635  ORF g.111635 m.111635 type:complete len:80 (-) comp19242_c0_seq3:56-295(-)
MLRPLGLNVGVSVMEVLVCYWKTDVPERYSASNFPVFIDYTQPCVYGIPVLEYPGLIKIVCHTGICFGGEKKKKKMECA